MEWTQNESFESWGPADDETVTKKKTPKVKRMPKEKAVRKKRRFDKFYGEPPAKRPAPSIRLEAGFKWNLQTLAGAADAVESGGKSPVSALNELGVKVHYTVLRQGGPAHCPSFTVAVTVADMNFEGWGNSKREARASAARACLSALLARAGRVLPAPQQHQDFTSDEPAKCPVSEFQCLETKMSTPPPHLGLPGTNGTSNGSGGGRPPTPPPSPSTALFGSTAAPPAHKSPINVLYENYSGLVFHCTYGDGSPLDANQAPMQLSHSMRFKVVCQIKEHKYEGYGSSKKLAKLAAARSALASLDAPRPGGGAGAGPGGASPSAGAALQQALADHIGKLVNEKFNELMKADLVHSKRKVLAGIVITINSRLEDARVLAVTTGTKCVSGEHMSVTGRAVNDCHAEVAARRCLQRHLYAQLLMYASRPDPRAPIAESDLEPAPGGGYQLKGSRQLHLYISTAPCGDGRIFSPHEQHDHEPDKHPNRLARGQLRTKIESGEGTIPVKNCNNIVQTWDGVMQGERLLTMSCSDKVARWCVAGLQGALLSRLVAPVYLHSLVLGSLLHPHHMYRATCGRIEAYLSQLPPPFRLARPLLARAASAEARSPARAPSFSVCWCATTPLPEVINATTGKLESGQPSLLCKQSMFARWQFLVQRLPLLPQDAEVAAPAELPARLDGLLYNEAKQLCPAYQLAKERLIDAFEKAKLGRWIKKPIEQDQFVCEITTADPNALFAWAGVYLHAWDSMANVVGRAGQEGHDDGEARLIEGAKSEGTDDEDVSEGGGRASCDIRRLHNVDKMCASNIDSNYHASKQNARNYKLISAGAANIDEVKFADDEYDRKVINSSPISDKSNKLNKCKLKVSTFIGCNSAQLSYDNNNNISDLNTSPSRATLNAYTKLVDKESNTKSNTNYAYKLAANVGADRSDDECSVPKSNISSNNQSLVNYSHLDSKETNNNTFNYSIGRGRGRLNILQHKVVSNLGVSKFYSISKDKNSVDSARPGINTSISTIKTNHFNSVGKSDDNVKSPDIRQDLQDKSVLQIQAMLEDIQLGGDKYNYWREFYKSRAKRRLARHNTSADDDIFDFANVKSNESYAELNTNDTDSVANVKNFASGRNLDAKDKQTHECKDDVVESTSGPDIEKAFVHLDKNNLVDHRHRGLADPTREVGEKGESSRLKPKINKFNLYLRRFRELDTFNDQVEPDCVADSKIKHVSVAHNNSSFDTQHNASNNINNILKNVNKAFKNSSEEYAQNKITNNVLLRKLRLYDQIK